MKIVSRLNNVVANEGKDAIFKCSVTPADVSLRWMFNDVPITSGTKFKIAHGGTSHSLTIVGVTLEDVGEVSVDAEGKVCKATLQVQSKTDQNVYTHTEFLHPHSLLIGLLDGQLFVSTDLLECSTDMV